MTRPWPGRRQRRRPARLASCGLLALLLAACGGEAALTGTDLGAQPAPDFALIDPDGATVRMSDLRGKAVALTFIFTNCPDVCPLTAEKLRETYERLPEGTRDDVALVAVSVDPERDTAAALDAFSAAHGLEGNPAWVPLRGERPALEAVWRDYGIFAAPASPFDVVGGLAGSPVPAAPPGGSPVASPGAATPAPSVGHTDALIVIDREGRQRAFLRSDFDPAALAADLETLAG